MGETLAHCGGTRRGGGRTPRPASRRPAPKLVLTADIVVDLRGTCLFYPCAGEDVYAPVQVFLPYVSSFWFVDLHYSGTVGDRHIRRLAHRHPLAVEPRLEPVDDPDWEGVMYADPGRPSFLKTATFTRARSGDPFAVRWCRNHGPAAMLDLPEPIGVFFYRGDGDGDGGSSIPWLCDARAKWRAYTGRMNAVLDRLVDGGLIVTDGSNTRLAESTGAPDPYRALGNSLYHRRNSPATAHAEAQPFEDEHGHRFRCIGHLGPDGHGYGPTLVWQVRKSPA